MNKIVPILLLFTLVCAGAQAVESAVYTDSMDSASGWSATGLWHIETHRSVSNGKSWAYNTGTPLYTYNVGTTKGTLTSQPIDLHGTQYPKVAFKSYYQTETTGTSYDTRTVQVGVNGVFTTVKQLSGDSMNTWSNPSIDLSAYAGKIIQLRFTFDSVDGLYNSYEGWYVDDLQVSNSSQPPPPVDGCTDTDGGYAPYTKGTVSGFHSGIAYSASDACTNANTLQEFYCSGTYYTSYTASCYNGYVCSNGACVSLCGNKVCDAGETVNSCPSDCTTDSCTDTDGNSIITQGKVNGTKNGTAYSYTDSCASSTSVNEYTCNGNKSQVATIACSGNTTSCQNGACVNLCGNGICDAGETPNSCPGDCSANSCADSDGGFQPFIAGAVNGTVNGSGYALFDSCMNSYTVNEYTCSGNTAASTAYNCNANGNGICSNGACVNTCGNGVCDPNENATSCPSDCTVDFCSDSDGGIDITTVGTVSGIANGVPYNVTDNCLDNVTISEYYCNGNAPAQTSLNCTIGNTTGTCLNGACV